MAKKPNRICYTCGNPYHYCPQCSEDISKPSWYAMWCGDICHKLNDILAEHTAKNITDVEAKEKIKELDLSMINIKDESNKKHIEEILGSVLDSEIQTEDVEIVKDIESTESTESTVNIEVATAPKKILGRRKK